MLKSKSISPSQQKALTTVFISFLFTLMDKAFANIWHTSLLLLSLFKCATWLKFWTWSCCVHPSFPVQMRWDTFRLEVRNTNSKLLTSNLQWPSVIVPRGCIEMACWSRLFFLGSTDFSSTAISGVCMNYCKFGQKRLVHVKYHKMQKQKELDMFLKRWSRDLESQYYYHYTIIY